MRINEAIKMALKTNGVIFRTRDEIEWETDAFHRRVEPNEDVCYLQTIALQDNVKALYFQEAAWVPSAKDILADDWAVETIENFKSYATQ